MISPKLFITTTSSIGVALPSRLASATGSSTSITLGVQVRLSENRPLSRNSAALLRLVTFLTHHRFPR